MNRNDAQQPIRVLNLFTVMDRGGAETMVMNYYRHLDRSKVQFDFLVHRAQRGAYDDEIEALGGRIYRMCPIYPQNFARYRRDVGLVNPANRRTFTVLVVGTGLAGASAAATPMPCASGSTLERRGEENMQ